MDNKALLEFIAMVAGAILSVAVEIPFIKKFFDTLTDGQKRIVMGVAVVLAGAVAFGLSCAGLLDVLVPGAGLACTTGGAILLARLIFFALMANQGTFGLVARGKPAPALPEGTQAPGPMGDHPERQ